MTENMDNFTDDASPNAGVATCEAVVAALVDRGFKLGGSRRMAQKYPGQVIVGPHTDWDFYADASDRRRSEVTALGLQLLDCPNHNYWDDLLVEMYQHPTLPIQVLLRRDVDIYCAAFESIDADTFIQHLWKSAPGRSFAGGGPDGERPFKAIVCAYFNNLFREHGLKTMAFDDAPF